MGRRCVTCRALRHRPRLRVTTNERIGISLRAHGGLEAPISIGMRHSEAGMRVACAGCVASIGTGLIPRAARGERKSRGARLGEPRVRLAARASVTSATAEHTGPRLAWARCRSMLSAIAGCGGTFGLAFAIERVGLT